MVANNGQHLNEKFGNAYAEETACCCKSPPPKCIINVAEFLKPAKSYAHLAIEGGLLENP